jgi:hypothetical protein
MRGKGKDRQLGLTLFDLLGCLRPIQPRQGDIHDHHVGLQLTSHADALLSIFRLASELQVVLRAEQRSDARAHDGVIIDQKDSDFLGRGGALSTIPDSHGQMTLDAARQFPKSVGCPKLAAAVTETEPPTALKPRGAFCPGIRLGPSRVRNCPD